MNVDWVAWQNERFRLYGRLLEQSEVSPDDSLAILQCCIDLSLHPVVVLSHFVGSVSHLMYNSDSLVPDF